MAVERLEVRFALGHAVGVAASGTLDVDLEVALAAAATLPREVARALGSDGDGGAHALALDAAADLALSVGFDVNVAAGRDAGVGSLGDGKGGQESGREEGEFGCESHELAPRSPSRGFAARWT